MKAKRSHLLAYHGTCIGHHHPEAAAVRIEQLSARYAAGNPLALEAVSLSIARGKRVALVGDNGSGKSTLLKCLAGLLTPCDGSAEVLGHRPGVCRHEVAYLPQRSSLDWDFPIAVSPFVLTGSYVRLGWLRRPGKAQRGRVTGAIEQLGLKPFARRLIGQLSGGQQQRMLLARTLVHDAELVLLDEPFNAVDDASRDIIWEVLEDLCERGRTVLMATHDIARYHERFDRVVTLENGRITKH